MKKFQSVLATVLTIAVALVTIVAVDSAGIVYTVSATAPHDAAAFDNPTVTTIAVSRDDDFDTGVFGWATNPIRQLLRQNGATDATVIIIVQPSGTTI